MSKRFVILNLDYFADLHDGLVYIHGMHPKKSINLLYTLNTAYLDTMRAKYDPHISESTKDCFQRYLLRPRTTKYDLLSLYYELDHFQSSIDMLSFYNANHRFEQRHEDQAEALLVLMRVITGVKAHFESQYGFDVDEVSDAYDTIIMYEQMVKLNPLPKRK